MLITKFGTIPSQGGLVLPNWNYGKKIAVPANSIDADLPYFPCPVYLNSSNFDFSKCKADGSDIRFTDKNLNFLKHERVEHGATEYTSDLCVGGSAISGGDYSGSYSASYAFDNSLSSFWICSQTGTAINGNAYIGYNFGTLKKIKRVTITTYAETAKIISSVKLQYLDNTIWKDADILTIPIVASTKFTFDVKGEFQSEQWRLLANANPTGVNWNVYEIEMMEAVNYFAKYNVLLPKVSDLTDTEFYMWYGNPNAYNTSIEAWQDMTGKQLTYNGNVKLVPNVAKFGKAAYFDGSGDYLTIPYSTDFNLGSGDFTIEMDLNITSHTVCMILDARSNFSYAMNYCIGLESGKFRFYASTTSSGTSGSWQISFVTTNAIPLNKLTHLKLVRSGTTLSWYIDEVLDSTTTINIAIGNPTSALYLGANGATGYNGYIDEFRLSNTARTIGLSQEPYTVDQYTKLLLHFDDYDAMRIATSTTGTDENAYLKTNIYTGTTAVIEAEVKVETSGSVRGQQLMIGNGSKIAIMDFKTNAITCGFDGASPYIYTINMTTGYHVCRIEMDTTQAVFKLDGNVIHTTAIVNLPANTTNQVVFGDGTSINNCGGSAMWKYCKYNGDYTGNPNNFVEWKPNKGLPTANGWTLYGTASLTSFVFKDETGKTVTTYGDVKPIKTAYADGARSAYISSNSTYLSVVDSEGFNYGTGNMSIETQYVPMNKTGDHMLYSQYLASPETAIEVFIRWSTSTLWFYVYESGTRLAKEEALPPMDTGTLYKIKACRDGNNFSLLINNAELGSATTASFTMPNMSTNINFGARPATYGANGYLAGCRVTKGRSRKTEQMPDKFDIDGSDVVFCTNFDTIYSQDYAMVQHMGDSLVDATGNGNNGTATGTTVVSTDYGKVRQFDGTDDKITTALFTNTDNVTLTVMATKVGTGGTDLLFYVGTSGTNGYGLYTNSLKFSLKASATFADTTVNNTTTPQVVTLTRTNGTWSAIIDGISYAVTNLSVTTPTGLTYFGGSTTDFYDGQLSNARHSTVARSAAYTKAEQKALKNTLLTITSA